ncbi:PREDICTED: LOW QUALITY PROTEIN: protein aubergine-like [Dufourea novaeangliae]|uniref:LOW QUALITY PROTEIN: protein aubergine-like n=1 Tax=Dufourea novaeangliae TaxID=178035 RepID=UPI000767B255|nr:PREDICTED: LOW QUALITY PROTEIN: protein aubergine-like [Dufourea novaeangliae]
MSERGRGRSGGRGRSHDDRKQPSQSRGEFVPASQPSTSAWSRRPGPPQQSGPSSQTPYSRTQGGTQSATRAVQRTSSARGDGAPGYAAEGGPEKMEVESAAGAGGDAGTLGRGAMRGRRPLPAEIHTRPASLVTKKGTTGTPTMLQANFFKLLATTDWCLYQYRVDFAPEEDRTVIRKGLLRLHKEKLGAYVFDGTVLYTSSRIHDTLELWSVRQSDDTKIRITVRLVGDMTKGDQHYIQFFNIIMRKCLSLLNLQLVGRDYFDARSKVEIREFRLELWPGYVTSIRQHESNILMCSEITHKVMRQQTLLDILNDCYQQSRHEYKKYYQEQVMGLVVLTDYNNNTYRITDIDFDANPNSTFQMKSGESVSYKDYYKIRAGQAELIYLVPELCRATGLTDSMRENFHLMRALSDHTRVSPKARIEKLMAFNRRLRSERAIVQELNEWNLKLDEKLVDIPGRILPPEKIVFARNVCGSAGPLANWTRELHNKTLFNPTRLRDWVVICMCRRMEHDVQRFLGILQECSRKMGCAIEAPRIWDIPDDRSNTYSDALEKIMSTSNPELVFCVVSNNRADRYGAIKKKCTVDRPVPSQVFMAKNLSPKDPRSIATKVAIQLACKLGGAPWSVELPPINLMVVGFDVCHDPNDKSRDFGAMVASLDKSLTRYFSAVSAHTLGEEMSNEFSVNITKALHSYRELNKCLPSHIVIYRDGVGEGQVPYVFEHEVEQIKSKLKDIYGDPSGVKMAFIIVTKRINTRIFHNRENPPPGTVIDDVVTNPMKYDFFIIPQSVRQGTVTPCAFNVIADTTGWRADQMQRITYKLCHMYYNWSGTVRVPAPCQYAHKLAFLVSQFIRRPPSSQMQNLLYYL